jgi:hypothetical protein
LKIFCTSWKLRVQIYITANKTGNYSMTKPS